MDKRLAALLSITGRMDGFLYRCRNDADYTMLYISEGILRVSGYPSTAVVGNKVCSFSSLIYPDDVDHVNARVASALETRGNWNIVYRIVGADAQPIWVREIGGGVFTDLGELEFLEGFVIDITELKRLEEITARALRDLEAANEELKVSKEAADQLRLAAEHYASDLELSRASLEHQASETIQLAEDLAIQKAEADVARERSEYLANHDLLTGLPNRRAFQEQLRSYLADTTNEGAGLLFIDLDRFKEVNDTLGHDAGDALLIKVAEQLGQIVRDGDFIARLGGDEFAFLLKAGHSVVRKRAAMIGKRILTALQIEVPAPRGPIKVGCTVGIAVAPDDANEAHELMLRADRLMYVGKKRGRNRLIEMCDVDDMDAAVRSGSGSR
jgi:diguanylate cyclase (GGDEF)-like protein/PAS domain S-box-containing protein